MLEPWDVVACHETNNIYVADCVFRCIWRISAATDGGGRVEKWIPSSKNNSATTVTIKPYSLSVTSRRLLATSRNDELFIYGEDGAELKRIVPSGDAMEVLRHAVETLHGTIIVSHLKPHPQVSEIDQDAKVIRTYGGKLELSDPRYLLTDSDGRVFVADYYNDRILLLDGRLKLERVMLDAERHALVKRPWRLDFIERIGQLIVSGYLANCIQIFTVR